MDSRVIQALRLLMDVTLSELDVGSGDMMERATVRADADTAADNPRFDRARYEALRQGVSDRDAEGGENVVLDDGDEAEVQPLVRPAERVVADERAAERRGAGVETVKRPRRLAFADTETEESKRTARAVTPDSDLEGTEIVRRDARPERVPGVNGRLTLQEISDHFELDARRYSM